MNRAQNLDRGFGIDPARAGIPLLGRFRRIHFPVAPASYRQFFSIFSVEQIAGPSCIGTSTMPALQNSPAIATIIVISVLSYDSQDMSQDTIFAREGADLVGRIRGNHSFSKRR